MIMGKRVLAVTGFMRNTISFNTFFSIPNTPLKDLPFEYLFYYCLKSLFIHSPNIKNHEVFYPTIEYAQKMYSTDVNYLYVRNLSM
jgi:hypothetical protein